MALTFIHTTLAGNAATSYGNAASGRVHADGEGGGLTLVDPTIPGNTGTATDASGTATGGILVGALEDWGPPTVQSTILAPNHGNSGGNFDQRRIGHGRRVNGTVDSGAYEVRPGQTGPMPSHVTVSAASTWGKALLALLLAGMWA